MAQTTITEALAEIPTIEKRIEKKSEFILNYLYRQSAVRDPHEKDGGSSTLIHRELQAIHGPAGADHQNSLGHSKSKC